MQSLSVKGIAAGIGTSIILSIPVGILFRYYFIEIYNDVAPNISISSDSDFAAFGNEFLFHPLSIAFMAIATFITVAFPSYIAALVADRGYIVNALAVGVFVLLTSLLAYEFIFEYPVLFALIAVIDLVVAYVAGLFRKKQAAGGND